VLVFCRMYRRPTLACRRREHREHKQTSVFLHCMLTLRANQHLHLCRVLQSFALAAAAQLPQAAAAAAASAAAAKEVVPSRQLHEAARAAIWPGTDLQHPPCQC
jgi:hypothetical protein